MPVYGFGGHYEGKTSHCFPLSEDGPSVHGLQGILEAYADAMSKYKLSGPTYFHEILENTIKYCTKIVDNE